MLSGRRARLGARVSLRPIRARKDWPANHSRPGEEAHNSPLPAESFRAAPRRSDCIGEEGGTSCREIMLPLQATVAAMWCSRRPCCRKGLESESFHDLLRSS